MKKFFLFLVLVIIVSYSSIGQAAEQIKPEENMIWYEIHSFFPYEKEMCGGQTISGDGLIFQSSILRDVSGKLTVGRSKVYIRMKDGIIIGFNSYRWKSDPDWSTITASMDADGTGHWETQSNGVQKFIFDEPVWVTVTQCRDRVPGSLDRDDPRSYEFTRYVSF